MNILSTDNHELIDILQKFGNLAFYGSYEEMIVDLRSVLNESADKNLLKDQMLQLIEYVALASPDDCVQNLGLDVPDDELHGFMIDIYNDAFV